MFLKNLIFSQKTFGKIKCMRNVCLQVSKFAKNMDGIEKPVKQRPNFFLGIQINNSEIHKKIKKLQEEIIERNSLLHSALVNVATLHVTLVVTQLKDENDIKLLKNNLDEWIGENKKLFFAEPITLNFTGTGVFSNRVAYVNIEKCENHQKILDISKSLSDLIKSCNFPIDEKPFKPHLTILKLTKNYELLKKKHVFKNDFELIQQCTDHFGTQKMCNIQLLSMDEPKCENGYYKCFYQIDLLKTEHDMDHSECCQPIPAPDANKDT